MTSEVEEVPPSHIRPGDEVQNSDKTQWITVARIRSGVVVRETETQKDETEFFVFESGQEGEQVWTFPETELVTRRVTE
jgi:hypothetical protein